MVARSRAQRAECRGGVERKERFIADAQNDRMVLRMTHGVFTAMACRDIQSRDSRTRRHKGIQGTGVL